MRQLTGFDRLINELDQSMRTIHATAPTTGRPYPAEGLIDKSQLNEQDKQLAGRLMRINHAGEVSAQGLYRGQAVSAKNDEIRAQMEASADEENDHLNWCKKRTKDLNTHTSYLNPVWYWGSFSIGAVAGLIGDKWSLGFVKETEDQVVRHLDKHLIELPANDLADLAILKKMKEDEQHHANVAVQAGGVKLPWPIRKITMPLMSKVMTNLSARI
ncbi:MAG: 2-polyprenyl-3-methyl-6-methoxy-1,4-benzoquinone monooxygenase [Thiotrichaceae bacterium]|nr:2-polyprenyl-3-methyl-6-methoxy-1,4-benzoquinone monooxygenase [Thiotrichaceae bacterium]